MGDSDVAAAVLGHEQVELLFDAADFPGIIAGQGVGGQVEEVAGVGVELLLLEGAEALDELLGLGAEVFDFADGRFL